MNRKKQKEPWKDFEEQVSAKSKRKLKARREGNHTVWFGNVWDCWLVDCSSNFARYRVRDLD